MLLRIMLEVGVVARTREVRWEVGEPEVEVQGVDSMERLILVEAVVDKKIIRQRLREQVGRALCIFDIC